MVRRGKWGGDRFTLQAKRDPNEKSAHAHLQRYVLRTACKFFEVRAWSRDFEPWVNLKTINEQGTKRMRQCEVASRPNLWHMCPYLVFSCPELSQYATMDTSWRVQYMMVQRTTLLCTRLFLNNSIFYPRQTAERCVMKGQIVECAWGSTKFVKKKDGHSTLLHSVR